MSGAQGNTGWPVLAGLAGLAMAYFVVEALRTGELKGRYSTHRRDKDPGTYWFGIAVLLLLCGYFLSQAL